MKSAYTLAVLLSVSACANDERAPAPGPGVGNTVLDAGQRPDAAAGDANGGADASAQDASAQDASAQDASAPDAASADAGALRMDAGPADSGATTPDAGAPAMGETCADAPSLADVSTALGGGRYAYRVTGSFGQRDDYNPLETAGKPPACSIVYDASGRDVVFRFTLSPGATIALSYGVQPNTRPGGVYLLDSCNPVTWPDYDQSGRCGNNEYRANGACLPLSCDPIEWQFTYPTALGGVPTVAKTFYLVLDEIGGATATGFTLDWTIRP